MNETVIPLHVRSGYSLLRGTSLPARLIERAQQLGHAQLALTDINNLCGATTFYEHASEVGLSAIIGTELQTNGCTAVALIADDSGYENLCRLITQIHCDEDFSLLDGLAELSTGLQVIVEDNSLAEELIAAGLGRKRLWLGIDPATQSWLQLHRLCDTARRFDLSLTATGKALMATDDELDAAQLLPAIRLGATWETITEDQLPHPKAYLRSNGELARQLTEFPEAVTNNLRLVEMCSQFKLLPRKPVFPAFDCPSGLSAPVYLRRLCCDGVAWRYGDTPPASLGARLERELKLIEAKGFSSYFLVVWDIVRYARRRGLPVAARGSGASSLVAYLLGITNVCPLRYDIPFERFLNEYRDDFPDLDIDFCWRIRDDVIGYTFRRWGSRRAAMVCTHNTFQPRSALRETAKAFGLSDEQISHLDKAELGDTGHLEKILSLCRRISCRSGPTAACAHSGT